MFIPYRVDMELNRTPVLTIAICVLCVLVFLQQNRSADSIAQAAQAYCAGHLPRDFLVSVEKVAGTRDAGACAGILAGIHGSGRADAVIDELAEDADPWSTKSPAASRAYTAQQLREVYAGFKRQVKPPLTDLLVFDPASRSLWHMVTAAFAHADWSHLIGNLIFFYAFASTVEIVIGPLAYPLVVLALAVGTHVFYGLTQVLAEQSVPTLGLSGVVMGMIGLFTYLAPQAHIRCFAWFLFFWRVFAIPAWILALWYVGLDVWRLLHDAGDSQTNFVAHVSGAVLGFMLGSFFAAQRALVQRELRAGGRRR
ncbi:MAG: rhomboid family intramembrane serine protease [Gammaproteobacteria bacterium]